MLMLMDMLMDMLIDMLMDMDIDMDIKSAGVAEGLSTGGMGAIFGGGVSSTLSPFLRKRRRRMSEASAAGEDVAIKRQKARGKQCEIFMVTMMINF